MDSDLGQALRSWRDRLDPASAGLSVGGRRRTRGLRREELALLAGVSVDYVTRLEQGRAVHPSGQVLAALARALQLSTAERDHLHRLARQPVPGAGRVPGHLTPAVQRLLRRLDELPVSVHDATWTLLAWNETWAALMGDPSATRGRERNLIWRHFSGGGVGRLVKDEAETAAFEAAAVGDLRAAAGRYPDDPDLRGLVSDLRRVSDRFARLWDAGVVGTHAGEVKVVAHPQVGRIVVACDVFTAHDSDLRIIVYSTEPGSEAAEKLAMVRVIGLQAMAVTPD